MKSTIKSYGVDFNIRHTLKDDVQHTYVRILWLLQFLEFFQAALPFQ